MESVASLLPSTAWSILIIAGIVAVGRTVHVSLFTKYFKLTYANAPVWTFFYFSGFAILIAVLFPHEIRTLFSHVSLLGYIGLTFLFIVIFPAIYRGLRKGDGVPEWLAIITPDEPILTLEERFILAKVADVVFQDFAAGALVLVLSNAGLSYPMIVGCFVALFAAAHLYIFHTSKFFWGLYYTTYAALGGFAIPFFILFVPAGIAYVLILHMLFYVVSAAFFATLPRPGKAVFRDIIGTEPI